MLLTYSSDPKLPALIFFHVFGVWWDTSWWPILSFARKCWLLPPITSQPSISNPCQALQGSQNHWAAQHKTWAAGSSAMFCMNQIKNLWPLVMVVLIEMIWSSLSRHRTDRTGQNWRNLEVIEALPINTISIHFNTGKWSLKVFQAKQREQLAPCFHL